jgi:hypothetical protein
LGLNKKEGAAAESPDLTGVGRLPEAAVPIAPGGVEERAWVCRANVDTRAGSGKFDSIDERNREPPHQQVDMVKDTVLTGHTAFKHSDPLVDIDPIIHVISLQGRLGDTESYDPVGFSRRGRVEHANVVDVVVLRFRLTNRFFSGDRGWDGDLGLESSGSETWRAARVGSVMLDHGRMDGQTGREPGKSRRN